MILGVSQDDLSSNTTLVSLDTEHPDERQIRLDTDRSFVLYPVGKAVERSGVFWDFHTLIRMTVRPCLEKTCKPSYTKSSLAYSKSDAS